MLTLDKNLFDIFHINEQSAAEIIHKINHHLQTHSAKECWQYCIENLFPQYKNFNLHLFIYHYLFPNTDHCPAPAWYPTKEIIHQSNIAHAMKDLHQDSYQEFHRWSADHYEAFWHYSMTKCGIIFEKPYTSLCKSGKNSAKPKWLVGAKFNIVDSCFKAKKDKIAIISQNELGNLEKYTYGDLDKLSNKIANSLIQHQFKRGDAISIIMPMNYLAVAIYLGIIKAGCVVVSIADSFSSDEIATRLNISNTKAVFTQDKIFRNDKYLDLYEKIVTANAQTIITIPCKNTLETKLRSQDFAWQDFLSDNETFHTTHFAADFPANIIFSSGTTGDPKAIVWTHTTPIKCAIDAYYHQDVHSNDILCWPTNLGWMMGPWLIFASLINNATMALFDGAPTSKKFGEFIQNAEVTILGLVPSIVSAWRVSHCMEDLNWSKIKLFSSSGECSNSEDMLYLMSLANYKPIIEYCGGTEIGGAYITSTIIQPNAPATFTTPTLGLDFVLLDEHNNLTDNGEVALVPPSIGLSNTLLNRDNYAVYYEGMPKYQHKILRRHGDQIEKINEDFYRALGRVDDTMKIGGIKVSSAEIERVFSHLDEIKESAAIAIPPKNGGPSQLIIFTVLNYEVNLSKEELLNIMQKSLREHLNPLIKISAIEIVDSLPRTASNKIMRRVLREKLM